MTLLKFGLALTLIDIGVMIGWMLRDIAQMIIDKRKKQANED